MKCVSADMMCAVYNEADAAAQGSTNICDLRYDQLQALYNIFNEESCRRRILDTVPEEFRQICNQSLSRSYDDPGRILYTSLGNQGMNVDQLVDLFEELDMVEAKAVLIEYEPVFVKQHPENNITAFVGNDVKVSCKASAIPPPTFQWYQGCTLLPNQTNPQLVIRNAGVDDSGDYWCVVSNDDPATGETFSVHTKKCHVTVKQGMAPVITVQPSNPSNDRIRPGTSITLHCRAEGTSPMQYEWFKNGIVMSDACSEDLYLQWLQPVDKKHKWTFQCAVSNNFGRVLSDPVTIELDYDDETTQHFAGDKVALIIANQFYSHFSDLNLAVPDAETLAKALSEIGFCIFAMINLNRTEMRNAIQLFCQNLDNNTYALFYFVGHGFEVLGKKYLLPTDAKNLVPNESVCIEDYLLKLIQKRQPKLCAGLFDICLTMPENVENNYSSFLKFERQPIKDSNMILGFSTTSLRSSFEVVGEGNGLYMKHLQKHIKEKRPLFNVLFSVNEEVQRDSRFAEKQVPWVECGLTAHLSLTDALLEKNKNCESWIELITDIERDVYLQTVGIVLRITLTPYKGLFCNAMEINFKVAETYHEPLCKGTTHHIFVIINKKCYPLENMLANTMYVYSLQQLNRDFVIQLCVRHATESEEHICHNTHVVFGLPFIAREMLWKNRLEGEDDLIAAQTAHA